MIGHVSKLTVVAYIINASYGGFPIRMKLLKLCSAHSVILPSEIFFDPPPPSMANNISYCYNDIYIKHR